MDDETRKVIESILDDWDHDGLRCCPKRTVWIDTISGRVATVNEAFNLDRGAPSPEGAFFEHHIYHTDDCPCTRLAKLVGRDGHIHHRR